MAVQIYWRSIFGTILVFISVLLVFLHENGHLPDMTYMHALSPMNAAFALGVFYCWETGYRLGRDGDTGPIIGLIVAVISCIPYACLLITGLLVPAKLDHTLNANWHAVFGALYGFGILGALLAICMLCNTGDRGNASRPYFFSIVVWIVMPVITVYNFAKNMEHAAAAGVSLLDPNARATEWVVVFVPFFITVGCTIFSWCAYCLVVGAYVYNNEEIEASPAFGCYLCCNNFVYMFGLMGSMIAFLVIIISYLNGGTDTIQSIFIPLLFMWIFLCVCAAYKPIDSYFMSLCLHVNPNMYYMDPSGPTPNGFAMPGFRGLSPQQALALPTHRLNRRGEANEKVCVICQDDFKVGDDVMTLECKHTLHATCGAEWLSNNAVCPVCKAEVSAPPDATTTIGANKGRGGGANAQRGREMVVIAAGESGSGSAADDAASSVVSRSGEASGTAESDDGKSVVSASAEPATLSASED